MKVLVTRICHFAVSSAQLSRSRTNSTVAAVAPVAPVAPVGMLSNVKPLTGNRGMDPCVMLGPTEETLTKRVLDSARPRRPRNEQHQASESLSRAASRMVADGDVNGMDALEKAAVSALLVQQVAPPPGSRPGMWNLMV